MEKVLELVKSKLNIDASELTIEYQDSGLTNSNYFVSSGTQKFVVRISGEKSGELGINRNAEFAAMKEAEKAGIGAEVLYFSVESGDMITRFIDGEKWSFEEFGQPEVIKKCALAMKRVHSLPEIRYEFSPYNDIRDRIAIAKQRKLELPYYLDTLLYKLSCIEQKRKKNSINCRGLCHNDPFANNFMDDGTVRLIDWEYAGMGDIFFDLACMGAFFNKEQKELLLKFYFGDITDDLFESFDDMLFVSAFWNAMWAVMQAGKSRESDEKCNYCQMARDIFSSIKLIND